MTCDLIEFTVNLLAVSHVFIFFNSIIIVNTIRSMDLPSMKTYVSSTNKIEGILFCTLDRSIIYQMKRSGPSTDPCGIPQVIAFNPDLFLLTNTTVFYALYNFKPE